MKTENKEIIKDLLYRYWIYAFAIICFILLIRSCQGSVAPLVAKTIKTKEVKGKFEAVKPKQEVVYKVVKGKTIYKTNPEDNFLQGQIDQLIAENKALQNYYNEASDSLQKALYNKAIEIKSFNQTFEDDKLKSEVSGLVRGEVQSIKLDYTIKPQTIELPQEKEVVFRLLGGVEYGNNSTLSNSIFKANLGFQNRKGNIVRVSADNFQNVYVGYDFSIFKIKGKKK